jgi:hypothetical protein
MESQGPSSAGSQELSPLEYSKPECWCESTGRYTNPQGQTIELHVRGQNPEVIEEYMKAVHIGFEVLPAREERQEQPPEKLDDKYQSLIEEEFKKLELHPELDLDIELDVIDTAGIELPYNLHAVIDPPIAGGATHNYRTKNKTKSCNVTLNATNNGVYGVLSGDRLKRADTYPPNPPTGTARFTGTATADGYLYFSVTGINASNSYTYNPSVTLIRI